MRRAAGEIHLKQRRQVAADECHHCAATGGRRTEDDDAGIPFGGIRAQVADALVEREQDPTIGPNPLQQDRIGGTSKTLISDGVSFVPGAPYVGAEFGREVLVKLELHARRSGNRLSSRASSAA
jgi:hypothetical protein